jgi:hypothetical protein
MFICLYIYTYIHLESYTNMYAYYFIIPIKIHFFCRYHPFLRRKRSTFHEHVPIYLRSFRKKMKKLLHSILMLQFLCIFILVCTFLSIFYFFKFRISIRYFYRFFYLKFSNYFLYDILLPKILFIYYLYNIKIDYSICIC